MNSSQVAVRPIKFRPLAVSRAPGAKRKPGEEQPAPPRSQSLRAVILVTDRWGISWHKADNGNGGRYAQDLHSLRSGLRSGERRYRHGGDHCFDLGRRAGVGYPLGFLSRPQRPRRSGSPGAVRVGGARATRPTRGDRAANRTDDRSPTPQPPAHRRSPDRSGLGYPR
jgi:hypothetical protein